MATAEVLNIGKKLYEGKTKEVYELLDSPGKVILQSKDQITAGNAARKNHMEGKAAISNKITCCIFQLLQEAGIKTAFTKKCGETAFTAPQCEMIPIEWVCRRIATGSFLKRNPGVKEGYKFYPPKVEMFFKVIILCFCFICYYNVAVNDYFYMILILVLIHFYLYILFHIHIFLFQLLLKSESQCRVVVLMGSISDFGHCEKIKKACGNFGIPCELRVTSAHKGPDETLRIKAEYEGDGIPTVFVAVAGRSNGLGPVVSGNTAYPVINCPPLTPDWGAQDVWSSLRLPSGLGCSTILSPEGSAQFAAQMFGLNNHLVWCKLRASILNTWISLKLADKKIRM
uniref:PurE domain-containing protein n=1 Tax=Microcebus murinus TaxID=30608 RepID=A0A8C5VS61_MICMU